MSKSNAGRLFLKDSINCINRWFNYIRDNSMSQQLEDFFSRKFDADLSEENENFFIEINNNKTKINDNLQNDKIGIDISSILNSINNTINNNNMLTPFSNNSLDIFDSDNNLFSPYSSHSLEIFNSTNSNTNSINSIGLIGKKRKKKIFVVNYPKIFYIFHPEENNNNNIIKIIDDFYENSVSPELINNLKRCRRDDNDNIRKKIKSHFLKSLKINIQKLLKLKRPEKFIFMPQGFVADISKDKNQEILDLTMNEIFEKFSCKIIKKNKNSISILDYINAKEINNKSNINKFLRIKYYQVFDEYLRSKEFLNNVLNLKKKYINKDYIKKYINLAFDLNQFLFD